MRLIRKLIFIPIAVVVVVFAVANRQAMTLELWPLPFAVDLPVYVAFLGALVAGIAIGGSVQWASDMRWRRRARAGERKADTLARDLEAAESRAAAAAEGRPALPPARALLPRLLGRRRAGEGA